MNSIMKVKISRYSRKNLYGTGGALVNNQNVARKSCIVLHSCMDRIFYCLVSFEFKSVTNKVLRTSISIS